MKVVFFGTPLFSANVLKWLLEHGIQVVAVVTKPDRPKGRSGAPVATPVKEIALQHSLPVYQPELVSDPAFAPTLSAYHADLFVVVAYGEIIKQHLLDMPSKGCINLHTSLLPKYRGAAPIQHAILAGEKETGVTIIHMVKKMDAGDIILAVKVPIGPDTTFGELEETLSAVGSQAILTVIRDIEQGTAPRVPQDATLMTLAPKIELEQCEIHWNRPAQEIHNLVRGVNPHPGAWCTVMIRDQKLRLKVFVTHLEESITGKLGEILSYGKGGIVIGCNPGALRLLQVQLEGKKVMSSEELTRGIPREHFTLQQKKVPS